jgi:predicted dinucleotide-binding enzyme
MTRIGIIGSGHIGGNLARLFTAAGHDVLVSFSTDPAKLAELAAGTGATAGTPAQAAAHGEVVVLSVPWGVLDEAIEQASSAGRAGPDRVVMFYAADDDTAARLAEELITGAGFDPVRTGTLARTEAGHQEPKGDLYGEEFHHDDAVAAVSRLRGTPPNGTGRP